MLFFGYAYEGFGGKGTRQNNCYNGGVWGPVGLGTSV